MLTAHDLSTVVRDALNDTNRLDDATLLRHLSRAQGWVTLRYRLFRHTYPIHLVANAPFVDLQGIITRLVLLTHVANDVGKTVYPVSFASLRLYDNQWIKTTGTPAGYYRIGWRYIGFYPVQSAAATYRITTMALPQVLTTMQDVVSIPDAYMTQVVKVTTGLLTIAQARRYQEGVAMIQDGLSFTESAARGGQNAAR